MALLRRPLIAPSALMDPRENCIDLSPSGRCVPSHPSLFSLPLLVFSFSFSSRGRRRLSVQAFILEPPLLRRPFYGFVDEGVFLVVLDKKGVTAGSDLIARKKIRFWLSARSEKRFQIGFFKTVKTSKMERERRVLVGSSRKRHA